MITEDNLYELGYRVKTRLTDPSHSVDFVHVDCDNKRKYLVNLDEGEISIIFPNHMPPRKIFFTKSFDEFKNWHDKYKP